MPASWTAATNDETRMGCHLIDNSLWSFFAQPGANIAVGLFELVFSVGSCSVWLICNQTMRMCRCLYQAFIKG
jgi:hypothetical protein